MRRPGPRGHAEAVHVGWIRGFPERHRELASGVFTPRLVAQEEQHLAGIFPTADVALVVADQKQPQTFATAGDLRIGGREEVVEADEAAGR
jgi:hypothetical protein